MPRPGPRRIPITVKLKPDAYNIVLDMADVETEGNKSEMARILMAEAVAARQAKEKR